MRGCRGGSEGSRRDVGFLGGGLEGMGAVLEGFKGVWGVLWGAGRDLEGSVWG